MRGYLDRGCVQSDLLATHRWKEGALTELLLEIDSSIHALSSWHQGSQTNSHLKCRFPESISKESFGVVSSWHPIPPLWSKSVSGRAESSQLRRN